MMRMNDVRVGTRIILLICAVILLVGIASWRGILAISGIADTAGDIHETDSWIMQEVMAVRGQRLEQELEIEKVLRFLEEDEGEEQTGRMDRIRAARRNYARYQGAIEAGLRRMGEILDDRRREGRISETVKSRFATLAGAVEAAGGAQDRYQKGVERAFSLMSRNRTEEAITALGALKSPDAAIEELLAAANAIAEAGRGEDQRLAETRNFVIMEVLGMSFVAILISLGLALYLQRSIVQPLKRARRAAQRLAAGDRSVDGDALMDAAGKDEVGELLAAMARTVDGVRETEGLLARERRFAETIVETAPVPLIVVNGDFEVRVANEAFCAALGARREEMEGSSLMGLNDGFWNRDEVRHALERIREGEERFGAIELSHDFARRGRRSFQLSGRRVWRQAGLDENLILINLVDTTERKRTEEELVAARESALEASEAKSRFLANMSHEIRTPLNAIIGMADLLGETELTADQRRYVEVSERAGNTLLNIINDILDLSRIEIGALKLDLASTDLVELLEAVCEITSLKAHEKGLELVLDVDPRLPAKLRCDSGRLRQVVTNLAGNAIKFTDEGEVVVSARLEKVTASGSAVVRFEVRDTGVGIAPAKLEEIFESFRQGDVSTTRKYGGTGLGLAISRALVEKMGGGIDVESRPGQGAVFGFTLVLETEEAEDGETVYPDGRFVGGSALVVGETTAMTSLRKVLEHCGLEVGRAKAAEAGDAMEDARRRGRPYQFVFVDGAVNGGPPAPRFQDEVPVCLVLREHAGDVNREGEWRTIGKPVSRAELIGVLESAVEPPRVPEAAENGAPASDRVYRVLLAEDSPDNQIVVSAYLRGGRYDVDIVENGREAVERFRADPDYDVVLMDIEMPRMDGFRATQEIRRLEAVSGRPRIPVIALTAYAMKREREMCLRSGCSDYLSKPLKKKALLNKLAAALHDRMPAAWRHRKKTEELMTDESKERKASHVLRTGGGEIRTETEVEPELKDLVPRYLQNRQKDLSTLESARREHDYTSIERIGHRLKGNGPTYGFATLGRIGMKMEKAAASRNDEDLDSSIRQLREYLNHYL